jgi:N-acetylated-alpha-linked acidic dipeptidase
MLSVTLVAIAVSLASPASADATSLTDATNAAVDARSLAAYHQLLGSEPHVAGTPGDARTVERLREAFAAMGLEVEVHRFRPYLARPIAARLELVGGEGTGDAAGEGRRRGVLSLDLRERNLLEDPATAHPDLSFGWNAYSGSGDVTGEVVYANYGRREDFARLKEEWGIDVRGKVVLVRYGGNFRGYKAKFAESAGAAAVLIYTDPADAGFVRGPTWPEGGWANDTCIQRGSILTLDWPGDPLTPGREATADATRLDPASIDLPTIPVQPIGYAAAERIMARMRGREVPDPAWKGGMPTPYLLDSAGKAVVRLVVEQERFLGETANVVGILRGATRPDEWVIVGCHHDAWGFGAADPLAGTMVLLESARAFAEAARNGQRPDRTVLFAAWGAEEFGIIGSVEWVEGRAKELATKGVAYLNLDMAAMGDRFGAGASPALRSALVAASKRAVSPFDGQPVFERWSAPSSQPKPAEPIGGADAGPRGPTLGDLGGGSDHVGFWCHAGIPSVTLGASGSAGSSYHSNYDTIAWYRRTVGEDYRSALLVTRMTNALIAELASGATLDDDPAAVIADTLRLLRSAQAAAGKAGLSTDIAPAIDAFVALEPLAARSTAALAAGPGDAAAANAALRALRNAWMADEGLPGRPWFRNLYAATDRWSGYAPAMLPLLAEAIEDRDEEALGRGVARYAAIAALLRGPLERLALDGG